MEITSRARCPRHWCRRSSSSCSPLGALTCHRAGPRRVGRRLRTVRRVRVRQPSRADLRPDL